MVGRRRISGLDPAIKAAFETFGKVVADSYGGANTVNSTNFGDGGDPLFTDPPGCLFHHQAVFITDLVFKDSAARRRDYDFFPFPDIDPDYAGAVEGAGDLFGLFHDTPAAKVLHEVPRHRPGPAHLGQDRWRTVRQQERHELPRRHRKRSAETC